MLIGAVPELGNSCRTVRVGIIAERFLTSAASSALKVLIERVEGQGGLPFGFEEIIERVFYKRQGRTWAQKAAISLRSPQEVRLGRCIRQSRAPPHDQCAGRLACLVARGEGPAFRRHAWRIGHQLRHIERHSQRRLQPCRQGRLVPAREQARIFAELFDRLAGRLRGILRSLYEHSRQFGTFPNTAPLRPRFFRSERAQQVARANNVLSLVRFRARTRFFRKLGALEEIVAGLQREARGTAREVAEGVAVSWRKQWTCLEVLDYDLNTSLRETTVVLKSFFCALPIKELPAFWQRIALVNSGAIRP